MLSVVFVTLIAPSSIVTDLPASGVDPAFKVAVNVTSWPTDGLVVDAVSVTVVAFVVPTFTVAVPDEAAYVLSPANAAV
jgi:hypothetical protein